MMNFLWGAIILRRSFRLGRAGVGSVKSAPGLTRRLSGFIPGEAVRPGTRDRSELAMMVAWYFSDGSGTIDTWVKGGISVPRGEV